VNWLINTIRCYQQTAPSCPEKDLQLGLEIAECDACAQSRLQKQEEVMNLYMAIWIANWLPE